MHISNQKTLCKLIFSICAGILLSIILNVIIIPSQNLIITYYLIKFIAFSVVFSAIIYKVLTVDRNIITALYVVGISSLMAIIGVFIVIGIMNPSYNGPNGEASLYLRTILVSNLLWIPTFYFLIKREMSIYIKLSISIFLPLIGCCLICLSPVGVFVFIILIYIFIPISFLVVFLLSIIKLPEIKF